MQKNIDLKKILDQFEEILEFYLLRKTPFSIPKKGKEIIVKIAPYFSILGVVVSLPIILISLGLASLVAPLKLFFRLQYAKNPFDFNFIFSTLILAIIIFLEAIAIPGLFKRKQKAWRFLFYASLLSIPYGVFNGDFIWTIIFTLLSWYVLFQVKEYYK